MDPPNDLLDIIDGFLPGERDRVGRTYRNDAGFRALCRDLRACHATLDRLRSQDTPRGRALHMEYAALLEELVAEIRDWRDHSPENARPDR